MNINEEALKLHEENRGKIEVISKTEVKDLHDLAVVYTPGVAEPCRKIYEKTSEVYKYTSKGNMVAGALKPEMVKTMASDSIIFAMANPTPEIMPDVAKVAGVRIVATGRSDFPNQVNNCLGFPAIFKGALKVRASQINEKMKLAAAYALASLISEEELSDDNVIADVFDPRVVERESEAVAKAAIESGVARI